MILLFQAVKYSRNYKKKYDYFRSKLRKPVSLLYCHKVVSNILNVDICHAFINNMSHTHTYCKVWVLSGVNFFISKHFFIIYYVGHGYGFFQNKYINIVWHRLRWTKINEIANLLLLYETFVIFYTDSNDLIKIYIVIIFNPGICDNSYYSDYHWWWNIKSDSC